MSNESTIKRSGMLRTRASAPSFAATRHNISVEVISYHLHNNSVSTPESDYIVAGLLHDVDAFGLKAEFADDGITPKTHIRVMMPPLEGGGNRRDIFALSRRRSGGPAMDAGSRIIFERCSYDAETKTVLAQFSHGAASNQQLKDGSRLFLPNMMTCVLPEKWNKSPPNKGWAGKTHVLIADVSDAERILTEQDLREHIGFVLENTVIGTPGFILLCRQLFDVTRLSEEAAIELARDISTRVGVSHVMTPQRIAGPDGVTWRPKTSEEVFLEFKKMHSSLVARIGKYEFDMEFVPMISVNQARSLVPSNSSLNAKGKDNSLTYGFFEAISKEEAEAPGALYPAAHEGVIYALVDVGWAPSHVVIDRQPLTNGGELVFSSYQSPHNNLDIMALDDIITPNTQPYHVAAVKEQMVKYLAMRHKYWSARKEQIARTAQAATHDASREAPRYGLRR